MGRPDPGEREPSAGFQHTWSIVFAFLAGFFFKDAATAALSRSFPSAGWTSLAGMLLPAALGWVAGMAIQSWRSSGRARAKVVHPEEPWLWNEEWTEGRIAYSSLGAAIALAVFAVFTGLAAFAVTVALLQQFSFGLLFCWLLFGLAALVVTGFAVAVVREHFAFGRSYLALETLPGVVGGELAGTVEVRLPGADHAQEFRVSLACSVPGRKRSAWEKELVVASDAWRRNGERIDVPFRFEIPGDLPASSSEADSTGTDWQIDVRAKTPRGSYQSKFTVPVFRTFRSPAVEPAAPPASEPREESARAGTGRRLFAYSFGAIMLLLFSAGPLLGIAFGGYLFYDWQTSGREDLGRIGKHAMSERRDCQFFYKGTSGKRHFSGRTFYVYPVEGKAYACNADNGFTERDDRSGTCPCLSLREAEANKVSRFRCEEHVDVLFDPARPTDCRPANAIGRRSESDKGNLLGAFVLIAAGGGGLFSVFRKWIRS